MVRVHLDPPFLCKNRLDHQGQTLALIIQSDGLSTDKQLTSFREKHRYRSGNVSETSPRSQDQERYCSKSSTLTATSKEDAWESTAFGPKRGNQRTSGFALSGSNQARKGRLVDALAARGDEGRDTLR